jgi:hypothetical protein
LQPEALNTARDASSGLPLGHPPFETVFEAETETVLGAFGDDGDIGVKVVEVLSLARQAHFAIPDDDSHGGVERKAITKIVADSQDGKGEEEERFLTAQPDHSQERKGKRKRRTAAFGMTWSVGGTT